MTTVDTIVEAIEGHRTLNFGYHGTTNELKMLAYQTEGGSNSGVCPKLRYFAVSDILGLEVGTAFYVPADEAATSQYASFTKLYAKV